MCRLWTGRRWAIWLACVRRCKCVRCTELSANNIFLLQMELRFRVLRGPQLAPRATLANARPSEDPGKLSSSALAWRRRQCVNRGGPPMPQRAWREDIRATRAKTFLESCLKRKGFREKARAWVVGGARCFALAAATRWRLQRVPQRRSLPSSTACARRVDGSASRGSAQRAERSAVRAALRAALRDAGVEASCAAPASNGAHASQRRPPR